MSITRIGYLLSKITYAAGSGLAGRTFACNIWCCGVNPLNSIAAWKRGSTKVKE